MQQGNGAVHAAVPRSDESHRSFPSLAVGVTVFSIGLAVLLTNFSRSDLGIVVGVTLMLLGLVLGFSPLIVQAVTGRRA